MKKKWIYCLLLVMCLAVAGCQGSGTSDTKSTEAVNFPISGAGTEAVNDTTESTDIVDDTSDTEGAESTEYRDGPFTLDEIPEALQQAIVAIEDERFYSHHGIDVHGILRAFFKGITSGSFSEGASTITPDRIARLIRSCFLVMWIGFIAGAPFL